MHRDEAARTSSDKTENLDGSGEAATYEVGA
jgi:hypothetical protein